MIGIHNNNLKNRGVRPARTSLRDGGGFTLVELLITVGLFAIIIAIAVGAFTSAIRTQRRVTSLISAQSNVSLVMEQMARQVRTGYLFCHVPGTVANPTPAPLPACGCTIDPLTPNTWTCSALTFYSAESQHVEYAAQGGALAESTDVDRNGNGGTYQSVTGDSVSLKYLKFVLQGQDEGDQWTPRVTVSLGITPSSSDPAVQSDVFNLQTTISARTIDCITGDAALGSC